MKEQKYYGHGSDDCIHAHACRRMRKQAEAQTGKRIIMGCDKDTCVAYEQKDDEEYIYTREDALQIIAGVMRDTIYGFSDPYDLLPEDYVMR